MNCVLGISAYYHDSAAAIVVDGIAIAAAQEERFSRIKHDARFPALAIRYCLDEVGIEPSELRGVAFYERPAWKFGRLVETHLASVPHHFGSFESAMSTWLGGKLSMAKRLRRELKLPRRIPITFCDHHRCHAASAFYTSPFDDAAIVTVDAVGEWTTTAIHRGRGSSIETLHTQAFPHSLGLVYSAFTSFAGFNVNDGEYKLMGLAPLGSPRFVDLILEKVLTLRGDGSFRVNSQYVDVLGEETLVTASLCRLLGAQPRRSDEPLREIDRDVAASIQKVTDMAMLNITEHAKRLTGLDQVCFAGGVALNCVSTGKLLSTSRRDDLWVQPAAGDAGCALGAAMLAATSEGQGRTTRRGFRFDPRLGPAFDDDAVEAELQSHGLQYERVANDQQLASRTAELIAGGKIVAWYQGRMEFGPRALGNRSILADPRRADMQSILNGRIKHREDFRPFAPAILSSRASEWFEIDSTDEFPWMNFVVPVRVDKRELIPAVTHVDGSARVQTVNESMGPFHDLLTAFDSLTGCPIMINTSFNDAGEPIVCTPRDAIRCFIATRMDALVLGRFIVSPIETQGEQQRVLRRLSLGPEVVKSTPSLVAKIRRRIESLVRPLNRLLSRLALAVFYFGVFVPMGLIARCFGYDPLGQRPRTSPTSEWLRKGAVGTHESTGSHEESGIGVLGEFLHFLREEKKWWLAPILIICLVLLFLVAVSASPVAPFVYTLF